MVSRRTGPVSLVRYGPAEAALADRSRAAARLLTHSMPAFRLTPGSDTSTDVATLLRDVMLPIRGGRLRS